MFIKAKQRAELEIFCIALWLLLENRNKTFHERTSGLPNRLASKAKELISHYRISMEQQTIAVGKLPQAEWFPLPMQYMKINTDAAFDRRTGLSRSGAVIWDHGGRILVSAISKQERAQSVLQAELRAIRFGLFVAVERGYNNIIVESDSMMAISLVNKEDVNWDGGAIVKDISDTVQGCGSCQFQYAGRRANRSS